MIVLVGAVVWATTVELNCSENSRRRVAIRRSESRAIFCARALSSMAFTFREEFGFEFSGAGFLLDATFNFETGLFAGKLTFTLLQRFTLGGGGGELIVELVEKSADVRGLRGHLGAGRCNDVGGEAKAGGDVETGGSAWNAEAQLVRGSEGLLVEADGGIEDTWMIGGVDLE